MGHRSLAVLQKYLSPSVLDVSLIHIWSCILELVPSEGCCLHFVTIGLLNSLPVPCNLIHPWFLHSTPDFSHVLSFPVHILAHYSPLWSHKHTALLQRHGWSSSFSFSYFNLYSQTSCILLIYIYHKNHFVTSFYFPLCSIDIPKSHCTVPLPP
jgi:hypothetical protein